MYLAENPDQVHSVREIAEQKMVPYAFARSIQRDLIDAGLVVTKLGSAGGALLARDPKDIDLFEVITAIQGEPSSAVCKKEPDWCAVIDDCKAHPIWVELDTQIKDYLQAQSIADIV
ncbi:MAG: Rrf2 family transcriptional regulator [Coriobacteriia bacterium]|nr:Rrf2 family transcriptional regulator [Coriobacteriia bacterium]